MLPVWRQHVPSGVAHFRELSGLDGTRDERSLPIEQWIPRIEETIRDHCICGIRSPPGSGKTMILPELLYKWAEDREESVQQAVMIVFPTQFGCLNIRDSLVNFRQHDS